MTDQTPRTSQEIAAALRAYDGRSCATFRLDPVTGACRCRCYKSTHDLDATIREAADQIERLQQENEELTGMHAVADEPITAEEWSAVEALRAKMLRTCEEYDIVKAVERAETAEAKIAQLEQSQAALRECVEITNHAYEVSESDLTRLREEQAALTEALKAYRSHAVEIALGVWNRWRQGLKGETGFTHSDGLDFEQRLRAAMAFEHFETSRQTQGGA